MGIRLYFSCCSTEEMLPILFRQLLALRLQKHCYDLDLIPSETSFKERRKLSRLHFLSLSFSSYFFSQILRQFAFRVLYQQASASAADFSLSFLFVVVAAFTFLLPLFLCLWLLWELDFLLNGDYKRLEI